MQLSSAALLLTSCALRTLLKDSPSVLLRQVTLLFWSATTCWFVSGLSHALVLLHTVRLVLSRTTRLPFFSRDSANGPVHSNAGYVVNTGVVPPGFCSTARRPCLSRDRL
jgi:hypothetical protein